MHDLAITGGTVVTDGRTGPLDVAIAAGVIVELGAHGGLGPAREHIDAAGMYVIPGAVDVHFHCRAPSHPERGTFNSETRAAAAGGVTTVLEMPISDPPCSTPEVLTSRRELGERECHVDFGLFAGGAVESTAQAEALVAAGAVAFKIFTHAPPQHRLHEFDGLWTQDESELYGALEAISATGYVTTVHAENQSLIELFAKTTEDGSRPARPPIVEAAAITLVGSLAAATGARVHIAHMSSAMSVRALQGARVAGADVTGETCPHYLVFDETEIDRFGSYVKVAPPLRPQEDTRALWDAVRGDDLQIVASDHAPFTPEEKRDAPYATAPQGLPGVETMLPIILDGAGKELLPLERAVSLLTDAPARRFGLYPRKGTLQPGGDADIVIWDPRVSTVLHVDSFVSRAGGVGLPYEGMVLSGRIRRTLLRGRTVYHEGEVVGAAEGRFVTGNGAGWSD